MTNRYGVFVLNLVLLSSAFANASERIAGIGIANDDHVYVWHKDGMVTSGTSGNFERYTHAAPYSLPPGKTVKNIVAMSIAGSNNHVFAWYDDNTVSSGISTDLDRYRTPYSYTLPPGKTPKDIVGIGITKDDRVYTWYRDITMSIGTTADLDKHQAPELYSLPIGKIASNIVEIDIAKSTDHVYAWYLDGTGSSGSSKHLDSHIPTFGYVPAQLIYRWWGPGPLSAQKIEVTVPAGGSGPRDRKKLSERYPDSEDEDTSRGPGRMKPQPKPGDDPNDAGSTDSPAFSTLFNAGSGNSIDPMVAAGNQYLIVTDTSTIRFFDKTGNLLPEKNGIGGSVSSNQFFGGFVAKTNADNSLNEANINLYLGFPKPCDSLDYPQTSTGKRFCIATFYDTRAFFDPGSKRFFIISNSRHPLWSGADSYQEDYGTCGVYENSDGVNVGSNSYCDLTRRYVAFAVSKTEDPRDGFHQYMITEPNNRDWPWMTVNGGAFVVAHKGGGIITGPVATILSVNAIKEGVPHAPYFRYYSKDMNGIRSALPPTHHQNAAGLVFLLGINKGLKLDIFAFPQTVDHWTAPPLLTTSVTFPTEKPNVMGAVFMKSKLYLIDPYLVETNSSGERYSVRLVRVPVEKLGGSLIKASTDASKGFSDRFFGRNATSDSPNDRLSYERPSVGVNKNGDMLIGYGRYPFVSQTPLNPEARYSMWYASEDKQRRSGLLQAGGAASDRTINVQIDYTTVVVDPADGISFWMALPYVDAEGNYRTKIGKVTP